MLAVPADCCAELLERACFRAIATRHRFVGSEVDVLRKETDRTIAEREIRSTWMMAAHRDVVEGAAAGRDQRVDAVGDVARRRNMVASTGVAAAHPVAKARAVLLIVPRNLAQQQRVSSSIHNVAEVSRHIALEDSMLRKTTLSHVAQRVGNPGHACPFGSHVAVVMCGIGRDAVNQVRRVHRVGSTLHHHLGRRTRTQKDGNFCEPQRASAELTVGSGVGVGSGIEVGRGIKRLLLDERQQMDMQAKRVRAKSTWRKLARHVVVVMQPECELLQVAKTHRAPRCFAGSLHCGEQQRHEYTDDRNHDQQFDECERAARRTVA